MGSRDLKTGAAASLDDFQNSFGLGKIKTAGEKSPQGKFSRVGQPRALLQGQVQDLLQDRVTGMAVYFHHVLPGITVGTVHDRQQDFIHHLAVVRGDYLSQNQMMGWKRWVVRAGGPEKARGNACASGR
jgi:hypothetical protein